MATKRKRKKVEGGFPTPWEKILDRDLKEGDMIEGFYRGYDDITSNKRTFRSYRIQPEDAGDNPAKWIAVSGGILKNLLERVPEGTYIWVTYIGKMETENGIAKNYQLEVEDGTALLPPGSTKSPGEHDLPAGA